MSHKSKNQQPMNCQRQTPPLPSDPVNGVMDQVKKWLSADSKSRLFELVAFVCLVIAVINFVEKGDIELLARVLEIVGLYAGIKSLSSK